MSVLVTDLIDQLIVNDSDQKTLRIHFKIFRYQGEVARFAEALNKNEYVHIFTLNFFDHYDNRNFTLNWDPLLQAFANRKKLRLVTIESAPKRRLLPLFRYQIFQALERNPNIQKLCLKGITFPTDSPTEGLVSFLDRAPSLTDLSLDCYGNRAFAHHIATALQRNNRLQSLSLMEECSPFLVCSILQKLASPDSTSCLAKLEYWPYRQFRFAEEFTQSVAEALRQYLESTSSTSLRNLDLNQVNFSFRSEFLILESLSRNTAVNHLGLFGCSIASPDEQSPQDDSTPTPQQLANFFQHTPPHLSELRISACNFFDHPVILNALVKNLTWRKSTLSCLDISFRLRLGQCIPIAAFRSLLTAVSASSKLNKFVFRGLEDFEHNDFSQAFIGAIPTFKVTELNILFEMDIEDFEDNVLQNRWLYEDNMQGQILEAFKRNYVVQNLTLECERNRSLLPSTEMHFNDANQARLEFYLNRNRKLLRWTKKPELVPRELWSYAVNLALEAGINTLFQGLVALSGLGMGLKQPGKRKRKRP